MLGASEESRKIRSNLRVWDRVMLLVNSEIETR